MVLRKRSRRRFGGLFGLERDDLDLAAFRHGIGLGLGIVLGLDLLVRHRDPAFGDLRRYRDHGHLAVFRRHELTFMSVEEALQRGIGRGFGRSRGGCANRKIGDGALFVQIAVEDVQHYGRDHAARAERALDLLPDQIAAVLFLEVLFLIAAVLQEAVVFLLAEFPGSVLERLDAFDGLRASHRWKA